MIDETRQYRDEAARKFRYDVGSLVANLRKRPKESKHVNILQEPQRILSLFPNSSLGTPFRKAPLCSQLLCGILTNMGSGNLINFKRSEAGASGIGVPRQELGHQEKAELCGKTFPNWSLGTRSERRMNQQVSS